MSLNNGAWVPIAGYPNYEVSNQGEIRNTSRNTLLKPQLGNAGYLYVHLSRNGKGRKYYVHHLVATAFVGERPYKHDVNHINGIKTDNRAVNLNYMTRTENMRHAREHGLHDNRGELCYIAKLTTADVLLIKMGHSTCGISAGEYAEALGVNVRTIKDVLEGKTWRHVKPEVV